MRHVRAVKKTRRWTAQGRHDVTGPAAPRIGAEGRALTDRQALVSTWVFYFKMGILFQGGARARFVRQAGAYRLSWGTAQVPPQAWVIRGSNATLLRASGTPERT